MSTQTALRLTAAMAILGVAQPLAAQDTAPVTVVMDSSSIAAGRLLFEGRGGCVPCHGEQGEGTPDGSSLIAGPWTLGDGSYPWLLHITRHAGWGTQSREGDPRPMRGPTVLDSAEVRRVAVYVFSISRGKPGSK
jgi:mono/diheme cytochrome c family protein